MAQEIEDLLAWKEQPEYPITNWESNLCNRPALPRGKKIIDRVQVQVSRTEYCMLIRHVDELHWCGYVLVPPEVWEGIESHVRKTSPIPVSYAGAQGKFISWMLPTTAGRMTVPAIICTDRGEDFWIGFSMIRMESQGGYDESPDKAMALLKRFHEVVQAGIDGLF